MSSLENVQSLQHKLLMLNLLTASQLSKSLSAFSSQLDPHNVVRFFKCMESSCDFCTDEEDKYEDHLRAHLDSPHCTYCNEVASDEHHLVEHMLAEHGSCRFQCALCFYRSKTVTHMRVHGIMVHNSKAVFWYACREKTTLNPKLVGHEKNHIGGYICKDCAFRSHCTEIFFEHLSVVHSGSFTVSCHICPVQTDSPNSLIDHYREIHNIFAFHCLYCDFGSQFDWDVIVHVTTCHPEKQFKIFCRGKEMPQSFKTLKDLEKSNLKDGVPPSFKSFSPHHTLKYNQQQRAEDKNCSLDSDINVKAPFKDGLEKCSDMRKGMFIPGFAMSETKCKCGAIFHDVGMFFLHLTEKHSQKQDFDCPKCLLLTGASVGDLFAHIVDSHTAFFRCCYRRCFFIGFSRQNIDDHVMQVHQHFDLPQEDAIGADHNLTLPSTESDMPCHDNPSKLTNVDGLPEVSTEKKSDWHLLERGLTYTCNLCCQPEMEPLDYFRHMSLGHGIKFFCGQCRKGYKLWKQMMMHHSRCHSDLHLSVKSFERNKLRDVTSELQSDCNYERQGGVESDVVKSKHDEPKDAGRAAIDTVAMNTAKEGFGVTVSQSSMRTDYKHHTSSVSTALHYSRTHKKALVSSSKESKQPTNKFRHLQLIPLGKNHAAHSQQKKCQPDYLNVASTQKDEFSKTGPEICARASESPPPSRSSVPQANVSKSPLTSSAHHKKVLPKENEGEAQQLRNDGKPSFFCGHCFKGYRLLKPLLTHQKTVHCELPIAVRKLHMEKLEDITNDVKKYGGVSTSKSVHHDVRALVGEEVCEVPPSHDSDSDDFEHSESERDQKVKHKWRRIKLICSDSEDDETSVVSELGNHEEEFSYYGKPVEPIDLENVYVRVTMGDALVKYSKLIALVNVSPIVLVHKEIIV